MFRDINALLRMQAMVGDKLLSNIISVSLLVLEKNI